MIRLGLRLHDGERLPLEELLPLVREKGFTCVHMALTKSMKGVPCTPAALTPGYAAYLRRQFDQNGLDVAVLGNYLNLADPDPDALAAAQELYFAHLRFASWLGCGVVGTETGAPNREYRFCPECRSEAALETFLRNLEPVVRRAENWGVTLAIEPVAKHIVWNPRRCRRVLDSIASPNLQVILDPVNLLDEENVDRAGEVIAEALELLGPDVAVVHLKDFRRAPDGSLRAVGAGTGEMDDRPILRYLKAEKPFVYATLENTTPENAAACRAALQQLYEEV